MTAEFWAIIGVGVGSATVVGALFTFLNSQISELRKDLRDSVNLLIEESARSEKRVNDRIDGVEKNLRELREDLRQVEARLNARIDGVEARIDGVETELGIRIDGLDARLRTVEQGQARVIGAVEMMQTIVVATLRREEVRAE